MQNSNFSKKGPPKKQDAATVVGGLIGSFIAVMAFGAPKAMSALFAKIFVLGTAGVFAVLFVIRTFWSLRQK